MAEQFNHKYELLFGQPITFYQNTFIAPAVETDPLSLYNYVDSEKVKSLKLQEHHIEFEIHKTKESGKQSSITIYNTTDLILHWLESKAGDNPVLILNAGYESSEMNLLFQGEVIKVRDHFEGPTRKTVVLIQSGTKNLKEAFTTRSYRKGVKVSQIIRDVIGDLKLPEGTVYYRDLEDIYINKPVVLNGKSIEVLKPILKGIGQKLFVEDGTVSIIPDNYVERDGRFVFDINQDNLIGSPSLKSDTETKQENESGNRSSISIKTTLNGAYQIGNLVSLTSRFHNGVYEIETITHRGSYEGSEWSSTLDIKPVDGWERRG